MERERGREMGREAGTKGKSKRERGMGGRREGGKDRVSYTIILITNLLSFSLCFLSQYVLHL